MTLAILNFPVNLLALSVAILIMCRVLGRRAGDIDPSFLGLVRDIVIVALIVTALGAFIDHSLVYQWDYFEGAYVVVLNPWLWTATVALIFASLLLSLVLVMRSLILPSAIASAAIAALSPLSWLLLMEAQTYASLTLMLIVSTATYLVLLSVTLYLLRRWHKSVHGSNAAVRPA